MVGKRETQSCSVHTKLIKIGTKLTINNCDDDTVLDCLFHSHQCLHLISIGVNARARIYNRAKQTKRSKTSTQIEMDRIARNASNYNRHTHTHTHAYNNHTEPASWKSYVSINRVNEIAIKLMNDSLFNENANSL